MKTANNSIILGSSSPRRKEIFSTFDFDFTIDGADIDEKAISEDLSPEEYTKTLAIRKGEALLDKHPDCIIITADTIVYHDKKYLCKPESKEEAFAMIKSLCGKKHIVGTALVLHSDGKMHAEYEQTFVTLRDLSDTQINSYIDTFHPLDKAGGYGVQDGGGILIQKIEGNFHNVVGFDVRLLEKLFAKIGINLWQHLSKNSS